MRILHFLHPSKKKAILVVILIIISIVGFNLLSPKKQTPLQFSEVKRQDIKETISSAGSLTGKDVVNLKFKSSGKLAYIKVKAGDSVLAYQTIAGLDTRLLQIDLQQAQNTFRDKQAIAEKAEDDVKDHTKDESFAQKVTRSTAQVARDNAYDEVKASQQAILDANIYTPISGIVTQTPIPFGQFVSSSDLIAQVADISSIYFETEVDEADINKIAKDQKAEIKLDAYGERIFRGIVDQIIPQTKSTSSGATVIPVRIKLEDADLNFVNGLSGEASIIVNQAQSTLTIPQEALRDDNTVFVQKDGTISGLKVIPGIYSDTEVEIKSGLNQGEKILLNPPAIGNTVGQNRSPLNQFMRSLGIGSRGNFSNGQRNGR